MKARKTPDVARMGQALSAPGIDPRVWASLGEVQDEPKTERSGTYVTVLLYANGAIHTCRVMQLWAGSGSGAHIPIEKGRQVLCVIPSGDPKAGVIVVGALANETDYMQFLDMLKVLQEVVAPDLSEEPTSSELETRAQNFTFNFTPGRNVLSTILDALQRTQVGTRARGYVTLTRDSADVETFVIPAKSLFSTDDGTEFESIAETSWFRGDTNPKDIDVVAVIPGRSGNIGSGKIKKILSLWFDKTIHVTNPASFNGGNVFYVENDGTHLTIDCGNGLTIVLGGENLQSLSLHATVGPTAGIASTEEIEVTIDRTSVTVIGPASGKSVIVDSSGVSVVGHPVVVSGAAAVGSLTVGGIQGATVGMPVPLNNEWVVWLTGLASLVGYTVSMPTDPIGTVEVEA